MQNKTKFFAVIGTLVTLTVLGTQVSADSTNLSEGKQLQNTRITNAKEYYQEGQISDRHMEILEAREELKGMGKHRGGQQGKMKDLLNEKGLNVTCEEMQEIRDLMSELNLRGNGNGRGRF